MTVSDGRVEQIDGSHENPVTAGFICSKVRGFTRRLYGDLRLEHPLRRTGNKGDGEFETITWEEAVGEITEQFKAIRSQWGAEAILPCNYGGSNGWVSDGFVDSLFFARLGVSRLDKTLCAVPSGTVARAMYGKMPGVAFEDFVHACCIVVWGANPKASNIHLVPFLKEARRRGAFVAVVDPVRNLTSSEADLHLPVRPGTDLPVALAIINLWRERSSLDNTFLTEHAIGLETLLERAAEWTVERAAFEAGVQAADIERLAREFLARSPAVMRCGLGPERNRNGGQTIAAILAMPALLGKFGVRGGGYTLSNSGAATLDREKVLGRFDWKTRVINQTQLGGALNDGLDPPIKSLFVYNCNPAATVPDQEAVLRGLAREDLFTVVFDQVMTDTARYADIVLPATAFTEHVDLRVGYGNYLMGNVRPIARPPGEAKSNIETFALLGRAMGFTEKAFCWGDDEAGQKVLEATLVNDAPLSPEAARSTSWRYDFPGPTPIMFEHVFPRTPDGKIHLTPAELGDRPYTYLPDATTDAFPLALVSPATSRTTNSTMGEYAIPELYVEMHPDDASSRGIADGDLVRVYNDLGELLCRARVGDHIRSGVVLIPKGSWQHASPSDRCATVLCPATVSDVGGGACYNDARVEVGSRER